MIPGLLEAQIHYINNFSISQMHQKLHLVKMTKSIFYNMLINIIGFNLFIISVLYMSSYYFV